MLKVLTVLRVQGLVLCAALLAPLAPLAPSPQAPAFRSGVNLIEVDVVVRDKSGHPGVG